MSKVEKLIKKYYNHTFDDMGCYTSDDYKSFERKYRNVLKEIGEEIGLDLHNFNGNHYEFSAVMKSKTDEKYYYISISDTRYWENEWCDSILYRTMEHDKDYRGGSNHYSNLRNLGENLKRLMSI